MPASKKAAAKPAAKHKAKAPWDKSNPKPADGHHPLSPQAKASAKRHAKAAGRPYPNLVDNMHAAAASKK